MFSAVAHRLSLSLLAAIALCLATLGLTPQQIALVVNRNNPDGMKLALDYAAARNIPDGRIITLDVPNAEELEFDDYERNVVPRVRGFLRDHDLQQQVKCLVTFYGVPFRIRNRVDTDAEKQEMAELKPRLNHLLDQIQPLVEQEEKLAHGLDPNFTATLKVPDATDFQNYSRRSLAAEMSIGRGINALKEPEVRHVALNHLLTLMGKLGGSAAVLEHLSPLGTPNPALEALREKTRQQTDAARKEVMRQEERRYDAGARAAVRRICAQFFGLMRLCEVMESQIDYLTPKDTNAALDNELSLLWLDYYPRNGPIANDMNFHIAGRLHMPMVMVSRLDGPNPRIVEQMIRTSVAVEAEGLKGDMVINSTGYPNHLDPDGRNQYKEFDGQFHDLGRMVRDYTAVPVHEDYTRLFNNREIKDAALYCGWYSLRHYVPGMVFSPGAVGYHVASLEMVSLHGDHEAGWVHGLLSDGVVATLGPVAEPYLSAFPPPGEFFPLLMTGKLTLAEVYWRTEPAASWMMCLVGDPLYTPYKIDPRMKPGDLPPELRTALESGLDSRLRRQ